MLYAPPEDRRRRGARHPRRRPRRDGRARSSCPPTPATRRRSQSSSSTARRVGPDDAEDPRAPRDHRRHAPQPERQGAQARAARPPAREPTERRAAAVQVSVTISGFTRLFDNDLRAVVDAARVADGAGRAPARRARSRRDGHAHRPLSVREVPVRARGAVAGAADPARGDRRRDRTGAARDRHPDLAAAARGAARQDRGDARSGVARPARSRRRHRLAARGVPRPRASRSPTAACASPTSCARASRSGRSAGRCRSSRRRCRSPTSGASPVPRRPGGVPLSFGTAATPEMVDAHGRARRGMAADLHDDARGAARRDRPAPGRVRGGRSRSRGAAPARDAAPGDRRGRSPRRARRRVPRPSRWPSGGSRWRASASAATSTTPKRRGALLRGSRPRVRGVVALARAHGRATRSSAYLFSFVVLGVVLGMLGPALEGLSAQVGASVSGISFVFVAQSAGYLVGALAGGRGYDRGLGHRLLAVRARARWPSGCSS